MIKFTDEHIKAFDKAIDTWGDDAQLMMAIEEMAELTKEIAKNFRNRNNPFEVQEETADVLITVMQVARIFDIKAVQGYIDLKMDRLKKRLDKIE